MEPMDPASIHKKNSRRNQFKQFILSNKQPDQEKRVSWADHQLVLKRVQSMETKFRITLTVLALAVTAISIWFWFSGLSERGDTVVVKSIALKNHLDVQVASISTTENGSSMLVLCDENGIPKIDIVASSIGSELRFYDDQSKKRISLSQLPIGSILSFLDQDNKSKISLGNVNDATSILVLNSDKGGIYLGALPNAQLLEILDESGIERFVLGISPHDQKILIRDKDGNVLHQESSLVNGIIQSVSR